MSSMWVWGLGLRVEVLSTFGLRDFVLRELDGFELGRKEMRVDGTRCQVPRCSG